MGLLALFLSLSLAVVLLPRWVADMRAAGLVRENWRGAEVAFPLGALLIAISLLALVLLAPLDELTGLELLEPELGRWIVFVLGVAFLGLLDDALGRGAEAGTPRGWRGHGRAVLAGRLSTGAIKAAGALGLGAFVLAGTGRGTTEYLADLALLLLLTNLFNLLDLRPGRVEKAFALLVAAVCLASWTAFPLELLGVFIGPVAVGAALTLRERAMLGDTGSNLIGALAGITLLVTLDDPARWVALGVVAALTIYGELRSISETVERIAPLRALDRLGRARDLPDRPLD